MNPRQKKCFSEAYDKLYDLNSAYGNKFYQALNELEQEAKSQGYCFKLNKYDKFKLTKVKE